MKPSIYNYFKETEQGWIVFNRFFGSIALLPASTGSMLMNGNLHDLSSEILDECLASGLIVDNDFNEFEEGRKRFDSNKKDYDVLDIIFELTQSCNFACPYCYQNKSRKSQFLPDDLIHKGATYVRNVLKSKHRSIRLLQVNFIGGEPLLFKEKIKTGLREFRQVVEEYGLDFKTKIDTNGYYLDEFIVENFNTISVALTNEADHDRSRPLRSKGGTYDVIVSKLKELKDTFNRAGTLLSIRFNANKENIVYLQDIFDLVKGIGIDNFQIDLQNTINYGFNTDKNFLSLHEFKKAYIDYLVRSAENELTITEFPLPTFAVCKAYIPYNLRISCDGKLGLCDAFLEPIATLDNLYQDPQNFLDIFKEYTDYNPYNDPECQQCLNIGICGGKYFCKNLKDTTDLTFCEFMSYYLDDYLDFFIKYYDQKPYLFKRLNVSE